MPLLRLLLACALIAALAACRPVEASAPPPGAVRGPSPAAAEPEAPAGTPLPDLVALPPDAARAVLAELGVSLQVVVFEPQPMITAQYPPAGAFVTPGETVTAWVGPPPAPPPPPPPPPEPEPSPAARVADGTSRKSQADDGDYPPRINPRYLPPSEPGTVLVGTASWYGEDFAGNGTACGEPFDPAALTLATRELRCGTRVLVTGPSGASVEAVVNDWGPAEWTGRRFDLSEATFSAIHHPGSGVITVTIEVLG